MIDLSQWQKAEYTGMKPGLERMQRFLRYLGNPERSVPAVHVAGTNGKGSVCAMIAESLNQAGYLSGLYTSPHLVRLNERIRMSGQSISGHALNALTKDIEAAARRHHLTFFEFMTAAAFMYFAARKADIMVLETGLGGRFDATNVIAKPLASVITSISLDHQAVLGSTLARIAAEKAGIIKNKCQVLCGARNATAARVIREHARRKSAPLLQIGFDFDCSDRKDGYLYSERGQSLRLEPGLGAAYQKDNIALACSALLNIRPAYPRLTDSVVAGGIAATRWPGRFDVREVQGRTVVLDGAHNPAAAEALIHSWRQAFGPGKKASLIFGVLRDKDYGRMIKTLKPVARRVTVIPLDSPRSLGVEAAAKKWKMAGIVEVGVSKNLKDALKSVMMHGESVLVTGSLFTVAEALKSIEGKQR